MCTVWCGWNAADFANRVTVLAKAEVVGSIPRSATLVPVYQSPTQYQYFPRYYWILLDRARVPHRANCGVKPGPGSFSRSFLRNKQQRNLPLDPSMAAQTRRRLPPSPPLPPNKQPAYTKRYKRLAYYRRKRSDLVSTESANNT